jgi:outer membrane protein assembly factor BamA
MRFATLLSILLFSLGVSACTSMVPRKDLPYPLTEKSFGDPVKVVTIPLPAIASNPNEGITAGVLTAFLLYNEKNEVSTLLAPQVNYNKHYGFSGSAYGAFYPSPSRSWEINLAQSEKVNYDYEVTGRDKTHLDGKLALNAFLFASADGSARFFGFEARSPQWQETNYTDEEIGFNISVGYDIARHYQLVLGERLRRVGIHQGAVTGIPFIRDVFSAPEVPGIDGFTTHAQRISLIYSTLDSKDLPTFGGYAKVTAEVSGKVLGSSADYRHFEAEIKGYIPLDNARYISVFRFVYNQTLGNSVPFLEQSILGGENTLRGYGRNRFVDNCYLLLNLEERIRLFRWEIFNVTADWEVAPFIDLGSVMDSVDKARARDFEFNPGLGLRALIRPNILGRIDVGYGKDGPAVFVGLGYPF